MRRRDRHFTFAKQIGCLMINRSVFHKLLYTTHNIFVLFFWALLCVTWLCTQDACWEHISCVMSDRTTHFGGGGRRMVNNSGGPSGWPHILLCCFGSLGFRVESGIWHVYKLCYGENIPLTMTDFRSLTCNKGWCYVKLLYLYSQSI